MDFCGRQVLSTTKNVTITDCADLIELPTELFTLTQLSALDLGSNRITKLPIELFNLTQLTTLALGDNRLAELPTEFGKLTQLTTLDLGSNSLAELPTEFGKLTQLTTLDLSSNSLAEVPSEFGKLTKLITLDLEDNILKLAQLTTLEVEVGDFYYTTVSQVSALTEFFGLKNLATLNLGSNSLTGLPTEFGKLTQLTTLGLGSNSLTELPTELFKLTRLATLGLGSNRLTELPTEFVKLTQLTTLDLEDNRLSELPTELFQLTQLTTLDLGSNSLTELPSDFANLTQLITLGLGSNSLTELPTEFFQLTQLATLGLGSNRITEFPTEFGKLTHLTTLGLGSNRLAALPTEFFKLTQLTTLGLGSNRLTELPIEFGKLTQLTTLDLDSNSLTELPTEFGKLTQLTSLHFGSNSLTKLPTEFGKLTQLMTLDFGSNSLTELPTEFGKLAQLTTLDLEENVHLVVLPFAPSGLGVKMVRSTSIDLSWSPPALLVGQIRGYQTSVTSEEVLGIFDSTNNQVEINLLKKFQRTSHRMYTVQVRAKLVVSNSQFDSSWSEPFNVTTCPASMEREETNEVEACYALAGFYRTRVGLARSCTSLEQDLPPGAIGQCLKSWLGIEDLPIQEEFWRASLSSEDIRVCPAVHFCKQRLSNLSFASPDRYCTPYHAGTYCSDCVENYVLGAGGCTFCTEEARKSTKQLVLVVGTLLMLYCLLYVYVLYSGGCFKKNDACCRHGSRRHNSGRMPRWKGCKKLGGRVFIWTKVRILFGYFQVLSSYRRTFLKHSLTESGDLLGVMALLSNVDLTWLVGNAAFRCVYDYNHYDILLAATLGPIVLAVLLFVCITATAHCIVRRPFKPVMHHTQSALLLMLFVVYPFVSQTVFGTFWCESFPDADRRFNLTTSALRADYRLSCEHNMDPERLGFEIYAGVMVVVYPIGVVGLYSWVLYVHKDRVKSVGNRAIAQENEDKLRKVSFLIKPYKWNRFWFEAYELVRKLMQTSFIGFLTGLSIGHELPAYVAAISLSLTVVFVVVLMVLRPYKHRPDFAFAVMSLLLLLPASLYSLLDPYARHEGITDYGLEALVITKLCMFALFVVFEIGRATSGAGWVKDRSCANRCLEQGGGGCVQTQEVDDGGSCDEQETPVEQSFVVALKMRIIELEASRESLKAEVQGLRQRVSATRGIVDAKVTSIQPL